MFSFYDKQFNEGLPEEEEGHIVGLIAELFSDGKTREGLPEYERDRG